MAKAQSPGSYASTLIARQKEDKTMNCKICSRDAEKDGYCELHLRAYENIIDKFRMWQRATNVSWSQYLVEIQKNSLTGEWAKEVTKYLIREETKDVR